MLYLNHVGVVALCHISSAHTALLLILIWLSELVRPKKYILVIHMSRFGIMLGYQSRATLWQYLG